MRKVKHLYSFDSRLKGLFYKNLKLFSLIITIPVVCLFLILYSVVTQHYVDQSEDFGSYSAQKLQVECDNILRQAEMQGIKLATNEHVKAYVASNSAAHTQMPVQNLLNLYQGINSFFDSVAIYSFTGNNYISNRGMGEIDAKTRSVLMQPMYQLEQRNVKFMPIARNNKYPFLIRLMFPLEIDKTKGAVVIDVNVEKFGDFAQNLKETNGWYNFIVCENKVVFGNSLKTQFNKDFSEFVTLKGKRALFDGKKHIIKETQSSYFPLKYISIVSINRFSPVESVLILFLLLGIVLCLVVAILVAYSITKRSITPFDLLIKTIESSDLVAMEKSNLPSELYYIIDDIKSHLIRNTQEMEKEMAARLLLLKTANVQAMQMQMKPHFLYNVLDAISWNLYSKLGEENEVSSALADLSDMYRMNVRMDGYIVPLKNEINYTQSYFKLISFIEGREISLEINIDNSLSERDVVKFTIQPLVENSLMHGLKAGKGKIIISAEADNDMLKIYVDDNGIGMNEEKIKAMNEELSRESNMPEEFSEIITQDMNSANATRCNEAISKSSGVALRNINSRIKMLMGNTCGLSFSKSKLGGLRATITLQLKNELN